MNRCHLVRCALAMTAAGGAACTSGGEDGKAEDSRQAEINALVDAIPELPVAAPRTEEGPASEPVEQGDYRCVTRPIEETRQHEEYVAFSANSESMWPGALVRGDSIDGGLLTQIVRPRAPATISVSLENIAGTRLATIDSPSLSSFREAVGGILAQELTGATPANMYAEIEEIHSEDQLGVAIGASAAFAGVPAQIAASFDFEDDTVKSRYLVKYVQAYYTVDVDQPGSPADVFADSVTASDLADVVGPDNPPLFVSSVTLGRVVMFAFESAYSTEELGAALEFVYSGGADVSGSVSVTYKEIVSSSKVTAYVLGGSGGAAAESLGSYEAIIDFIRSGGDYSRSSPGAPIAFKLAYLRDNGPARLSYTTEYQRRECERVTQKVLVTLHSISVVEAGNEDDDSLEIYGSITAAGRDAVVMFSRSEGDAVVVWQGDSWPAAGHLAERVVEVAPVPGSAIELGALLMERNPLGDDLLGDPTLPIPFEAGWRRDATLRLTGDSAQVDIDFSLTPI